jgi:hypothetical protein
MGSLAAALSGCEHTARASPFRVILGKEFASLEAHRVFGFSSPSHLMNFKSQI